MLDSNIAVCLDIGGTCIKAGLIDRSGKLLEIQRCATPASSPPDLVMHKILDMIKDLIGLKEDDWDSVTGIGVSIAAFITADGVVKATAHLSQEWIGYNLRECLESEFSTKYYFSLDVPAPTLGEAYFGAGKGFKNMVYVTVSTGIGAGIIINNQYFTGGLGWAGGFGHIIIDENSDRICEGCNNHGCLETFAATQGILTTAKEMMECNPNSKIWSFVDGDMTKVTPKLIFLAAEAGNATAIEIFRRCGHALGIGLTSLADIIAPERIVIGGGIAQAGNFLLDPARAVVQDCAFPPKIKEVKIVQAELGDLSGIYGAAVLVFYDMHVNP